MKLEVTEYKKNCPSCGKEQKYTGNHAKHNLTANIKKNTKCRNCLRVTNRITYCPLCKQQIVHKSYLCFWRASKENRMCLNCHKIITSKTHFKHGHKSYNPTTPEEIKKRKHIIKLAMHKPEIRKKHLDALHASRWIKVKTDIGQLELLEKWNRLGFKFEPNYQIHTDCDLFYIDGYDKEKNVVLEYDSKYHNKPHQKQKDSIRQQKIIDILQPSKFWRFDSVNKCWSKIT